MRILVGGAELGINRGMCRVLPLYFVALFCRVCCVIFFFFFLADID